MTVIKRDRQASTSDLVKAIEALNPLLRDQGEDEAVEALTGAMESLRKAEPGSKAHKASIDAIIEAFEGEHELMAYTHQRANATDWTEVEELSQASARVLSLARRMRA